jgi:Transcriptional activator of glycolytic enzymes
MADALASSEDPFDATLEKVMPGVHQRLKGTDDKVESLSRQVNESFSVLTETINSGFQSLVQQHGDVLRESCEMVGASLVQAGHHVMNTNRNPPTGVSTECPPLSPPVVLTGEPGSPETNLIPVPATPSPVASPAIDDLLVFFRMKAKHNSLRDLWDEWFGLNEWSNDEYCGVAGRNERFGAKWRKQAKALDKSQYSRTNRLIVAITNVSTMRNCQPDDIVLEWEPLFQQSRFSVANLVRGLQELNMIPKMKSRGGTKKGD